MKVRCGECNFEENSKCKLKEMKIKKNKRRNCDSYEFSEEKEVSRLERKAKVLDKKDAAYRRKMERLKSPTYNKADDTHPITGDLSRFKTTATD